VRVFSYKITRDYGFAPNPFHGVCTLATCKPNIRKAASVGDIVVGCGSTANHLPGHAIFVLRVTEKYPFQEYWDNTRFAKKRPNFHASASHAYGDNIYHHGDDGAWIQERSHHSFPNGAVNPLNLDRDTARSDSVLLSEDFVYFGNNAPEIPQHLRSFEGVDLYPTKVRDCRSHFSPNFIAAIDHWFRGLPRGNRGRPEAWK
jgi:hypothetical protein